MQMALGQRAFGHVCMYLCITTPSKMQQGRRSPAQARMRVPSYSHVAMEQACFMTPLHNLEHLCRHQCQLPLIQGTVLLRVRRGVACPADGWLQLACGMLQDTCPLGKPQP